MIVPFLAALLVAQTPGQVDPAEIAHAIEAKRLDQARQMLANAAAAGETAPEFDRLRADLAFARKNWPDAHARYLALAAADPKDGRSAERAAIASIILGDTAAADALIEQAIQSGKATWRAWNAKAVLCDQRGDWTCADEAFQVATSMAPDQPQVLNNHGWSLLLRGQWGDAAELLEKASDLGPHLRRSQNNLELARAALAEDLPQRRPDESDADFAARLNDAGVLAAMRGDRGRAIAAFSRALEVSDSWYARAAANLERVKP